MALDGKYSTLGHVFSRWLLTRVQSERGIASKGPKIYLLIRRHVSEVQRRHGHRLTVHRTTCPTCH